MTSIVSFDSCHDDVDEVSDDVQLWGGFIERYKMRKKVRKKNDVFILLCKVDSSGRKAGLNTKKVACQRIEEAEQKPVTQSPQTHLLSL